MLSHLHRCNNLFDWLMKKSSLIVLWNMMVINNWQVTIQAFIDVTSQWSVIYFVAWWVVCPVITLNMCVSLILDVSSLMLASLGCSFSCNPVRLPLQAVRAQMGEDYAASVDATRDLDASRTSHQVHTSPLQRLQVEGRRRAHQPRVGQAHLHRLRAHDEELRRRLILSIIYLFLILCNLK